MGAAWDATAALIGRVLSGLAAMALLMRAVHFEALTVPRIFCRPRAA
jgi:hypothetical protein